METFLQSKPKRLKPSDEAQEIARTADHEENAEDTEFKLAVLASLHPNVSQDVHLEYLLDNGGSAVKACEALSNVFNDATERKRKLPATIGYQSSINAFATSGRESQDAGQEPRKLATKKGKTLHLYSPKDIEKHTPCSIIHNFLPTELADSLLKELLVEASTFQRGTFQMFERTVQSPHTWKFYVDTLEELKRQKTEYTYDGAVYESQLSQTTPVMLEVSAIVKETVNEQVERRMQDFQPNGERLKFQSPDAWEPNASFVNCYDGGKENVGYHSDQLTYLGPRTIIGSLSLGVGREFRVRRIVPPDATQADEQGQIAIHLPHNSLLVMHAEMQEEWKHSIAPAQAIDPHPLAQNKRLNITYRCYKDYLHPKYTPKCRCGVSCVLRCVQKRKVTRGRYMWQCYANYTPGKKGCTYFVWAEFDEDGKPPWAEGYKGNANVPLLEEEPPDEDDTVPP
ncbi:hypothetical protein CLAFUW4_09124 [Fulvia fulva]|uniref:Fe2OG dioxygenase domain-containing protein n=1 Tax=Passalora fulva TaxID=5499 RepID=A0A9Q8PGV9_PASFU|nr:uncharacterized protein CLAFUR5_09235 [Fulvia fulva]KAK4613657.1 hypothetical protein CLAFUR4_09130 [Fulvia fulva]KAK4614891.1 hypothetical protein CLAFUR0_09122 [Fulvia fulva]UJO22190.1 hypothetical protein CLAFUR5_09235 [Fulvia fulva]WPV20394.1 hypothetical protein CLAFUW4_09124 [Fulvia fulva]WPV35310.1 hypothetical protein CLAFUW7_09125 [Fulvia fulva]